jgi:molecular chaperone HtpG
MSERTGSIQVQTQDIFPIIKKWLYSEHDIFIRELVSNSTDAITKRATFARTHNAETPEGAITVTVNKEAKTIVIEDNGVGMTEQEVEKYIAQLAFSGAEDFVKKMKEQGEDKASDIIGKFGLGFYSAFMVADKVEVDSLSMNEGAVPTKWTCEGETEYTFGPSDRTTVGTKITLHTNKDGEEFLSEWKISETLRQFCDFMPYPISVVDGNSKEEKAEPTIINTTTPLWKKDPTTLTDEDYKAFYRQKFPMDGDPLFWIHLKIDHPFTLEGVLFFPRFNPNKTPFNERNIRLYSKQVFVSDNVKNIIPEFLALLKGCIDSTDIPLNVSRSALQGDPNIRRISNYVVKKVAESLKKLFKSDRKRYEEIWEDIGLFVKYGCVSDTKFDESMRSMVLFKNSDQNFMTLSEYHDSVPEKFKEKLAETIVYVEKDKSDGSLRAQLKEEGVQCLEMDDHIDPHFMQHAEIHKVGEQATKFSTVDTMIGQLLESEATDESDIKVKELFERILFTGEKKSADDESLVEIAKMKNSRFPAYFKIDENMKRFAKMAQSMGQGTNAFPVKRTLVINPTNPLIQNALKLHEKGGQEQLVEKLCHHVQDLATISSEGLKTEEKDQFVARSQSLIQDLSSLVL